MRFTVLLPALICAGMMLLICIPMLLGHKNKHRSTPAGSSQEVAELREEVARRKAQRGLEGKREPRDG